MILFKSRLRRRIEAKIEALKEEMAMYRAVANPDDKGCRKEHHYLIQIKLLKEMLNE